MLAAATERPVNPQAAVYLNRLSDLLFVLARAANPPGEEPLWKPGATRELRVGESMRTKNVSCTSLGRLAAYSTAERSGFDVLLHGGRDRGARELLDEAEPAADVDVEEALHLVRHLGGVDRVLQRALRDPVTPGWRRPRCRPARS